MTALLSFSTSVIKRQSSSSHTKAQSFHLLLLPSSVDKGTRANMGYRGEEHAVLHSFRVCLPGKCTLPTALQQSVPGLFKHNSMQGLVKVTKTTHPVRVAVHEALFLGSPKYFWSAHKINDHTFHETNAWIWSHRDMQLLTKTDASKDIILMGLLSVHPNGFKSSAVISVYCCKGTPANHTALAKSSFMLNKYSR